MRGKWIWTADGQEHENQRGCFGTSFLVQPGMEGVTLKISASTRYIVYINGQEIGRGPVRAGRAQWFYDSYSLDGILKEGRNFLAVRVWSYGWSTYQSLHAPGGLIFEVAQGENLLAASGREVHGILDTGHQSFAPKRNVNLGFTDYYDARNFDNTWTEKPETAEEWPMAQEIEDVWGTLESGDIRHFHWKNQYPQHIIGVEQVKKGCRQVTVNTRQAFFGDRRDADETIFSGFLGFRFESTESMEGMISFPNRTWNGILGDFCIDGRLYPVSNGNRGIPVAVEPGRHVFLMQISGKYDDLYAHIELDFPMPLKILEQEHGESFFTVGPTQRIVPVIDGFQRVYGGLDEFNRMEEETEDHQYVFSSESFSEIQARAEERELAFTWVDPRYVFWDEYLLSLARTEKVAVRECVGEEHLGILWNNDCDCLIRIPECDVKSRNELLTVSYPIH
ncbi:MAG: hypothetical protein Q4D16_22725, partial [Eubacteriales bacterium]|nr:hypothetical protein [Eubacteriales bacterium]